MEPVFVCLMLVLTSCSGHSESLSEDAQDLQRQRRDLVQECKTTALGLEYMGKISKTISGRSCQRWTSNSPHKHGFHDNSKFPDGSEQAANNYCRNPSRNAVGLWCYTTDPKQRWEACNVPVCECRTTELGLEYIGKMSRTISGRSCQRWTSNSPHKHDYHDNSKFPDGSEQAANNYCRNPSRHAVGLWCYTTDPKKRWEACYVPVCECKTTELGLEYMGKMSKTISGKSCQRWTSNSPHKHDYHDNSTFPDGSEQAANNYCRNPSRNAVGLWCYTTDPKKRWEACNVPVCAFAFRVDLELSSPMINNVGQPLRVPYNHVKMNVGGVYKVAQHAFVAPLPGVYMFMVDGLSAAKCPGCIELRKNNVIVDHAITAGGLSSMSINMPLKLQKGDAVFVTMCPTHNTLHHHGENAFTGYLLTQTS